MRRLAVASLATLLSAAIASPADKAFLNKAIAAFLQ